MLPTIPAWPSRRSRREPPGATVFDLQRSLTAQPAQDHLAHLLRAARHARVRREAQGHQEVVDQVAACAMRQRAQLVVGDLQPGVVQKSFGSEFPLLRCGFLLDLGKVRAAWTTSRTGY